MDVLNSTLWDYAEVRTLINRNLAKFTQEHEEVSEKHLHVALLIIGTCVILLTLIFEVLKEWLSEWAKDELRPILEHLFG